MVLSGSNKALMDSLRPSLTDRGLCTTMNSPKIASSYNTIDKRVDTFAGILDDLNDSNDLPIKIEGSGNLNSARFWLNVRDFSDNGLVEYSRGSVTLAINDWNEYFSVRYDTNFERITTHFASLDLIIDIII